MHNTQLPDPVLDAQFYAGVPIKRLFAWMIDVVVVFVITIALVLLTIGLGIFVFPLLLFGANLAYRILSLRKWSATLGMRLMGIEVRNMHGNRLEPNEAVFHTGLYILITLTGLGIPATILAMLINDRGQGLHDMLLGTTAINRPAD